MTDLTYEIVNELNKKSNLLDISIVDAAPSNMLMPGPKTMGTGPDYFNCFPFDGEKQNNTNRLVIRNCKCIWNCS